MDWKQNYVSLKTSCLHYFFLLHFPWCWTRSDVDPDNPQHEQYAASVVAALVQELESKANALTNEEFFLTKIKLQGAAEMFKVGLAILTSLLSTLNWLILKI